MGKTLRAGHPLATVLATLLPIVAMLLALLACTEDPASATVTVRGDRSLVVVAEIADEPSEHARGLMNRTELPPGTGMLFLFDDRREHSFWMKDTPIPLDLLVFRDQRVVQVFTMTPCPPADGNDCQRYPTEAADAALEVPAGTARDAGIEPGDAVLIEA